LWKMIVPTYFLFPAVMVQLESSWITGYGKHPDQACPVAAGLATLVAGTYFSGWRNGVRLSALTTGCSFLIVMATHYNFAPRRTTFIPDAQIPGGIRGAPTTNPKYRMSNYGS